MNPVTSDFSEKKKMMVHAPTGPFETIADYEGRH